MDTRHDHRHFERHVVSALKRIEGSLVTLYRQGLRFKMALADLKTTLARIDAATNNIAADITALKDKITTGMSPAEVAEVQGLLDAQATKLEGIAASTEDPVPGS